VSYGGNYAGAGELAQRWWHALLEMLRTPAPASRYDPVAYTRAEPAARPVAAAPNDVFTPTRPRAGRKTLVGRQHELARILDGIFDDGAHVVLYSERGRGKTSLSNLAIEQLRRRGAIVARCACEAETTFDTMMRMLVRDLPASLLRAGFGDEEYEGCEAILPRRTIRPADVATIPEHLSCPLAVFVVDEFDRVTDRETRTRLADTIKTLSDRGVRLYFMVVGVSETLEQIIGQHPSIQRNIVGVHLPLLRDDEVASMLAKGGQQAGIHFPDAATEIVQGVARGMPYMAQLLGLRIAQAALRRGDTQDEIVGVRDPDVLSAVERLLSEVNSSVALSYGSLTAPAADALDPATMLLLANAEQDEWGRMVVSRAGGHVVVGGCRLTAEQWHRLLRAEVVVQSEGETGPAQFRDRALIYHVLLLAARSRLLAGSGADVNTRARVRA
jgi:hypothetical protein